MFKTNFLIWNVLEKKCTLSINELNKTMAQLQKSEDLIVIKSLFVYGIATFENALTDILREFCKAFPQKIPQKEFKLLKDQILNDTEVIVEMFLDSAINKLTYASLEDYLVELTKLLGIDMIPHLSELIEIKETRNLLLHNNLVVNSIYLSKCKSDCIRADEKDINKLIPFEKDYAYNSLKLCADIFEKSIVIELRSKYSSFTKIKAMREVWDSLFCSPKLNFEDYWEYDEEGRLLGFKLERGILEANLSVAYSATEKILFSYIYMHYAGSLQGIEGINIDIYNPAYLYGDRKDKFLYLQRVLFRYPALFSQDLY